MNIEKITDVKEVVALLARCGLSAEGITDSAPPLFFGTRHGGKLVAVVGLELFPPFGLLRSLAVAPAFRLRDLGRTLVVFAELFSVSQGVKTLFLLTQNAESYFAELGYAAASRSMAPVAIQETVQFARLCPSSAVLMHKRIDEKREPPCPACQADQE